jgi:hypothetical protein
MTKLEFKKMLLEKLKYIKSNPQVSRAEQRNVLKLPSIRYTRIKSIESRAIGIIRMGMKHGCQEFHYEGSVFGGTLVYAIDCLKTDILATMEAANV